MQIEFQEAQKEGIKRKKKNTEWNHLYPLNGLVFQSNLYLLGLSVFSLQFWSFQEFPVNEKWDRNDFILKTQEMVHLNN